MGGYRTTTGEAPPLPAHERRRRRWRWVLGVAGAVGLVALLGRVIRLERDVVAAGYVTSEEHAEVRPSVAGVVTSILARTGQTVPAGALLAQLDAAEQAAALDGAHSALRKAQSELARREVETTEQRRLLADQTGMAALRHENARTRHGRMRELQERGLAAGAAVQDARLQEELAAAELASLRNRDTSIFEQDLEMLRHELAGRQDAVERAQALVRQRDIRAPVAGQVLRYDFVLGELVRPEVLLFEVFGGTRQILKLRVDERDAVRVAPGQRYRAELAPYGGLRRIWFTGRVEALRNAIQADGQKTYRVAYCTFDAGARAVPPGTSAEARISLGKACLWSLLLGYY